MGKLRVKLVDFRFGRPKDYVPRTNTTTATDEINSSQKGTAWCCLDTHDYQFEMREMNDAYHWSNIHWRGVLAAERRRLEGLPENVAENP